MTRRVRRHNNHHSSNQEHDFALYALSNTKNILGVVMFIWMMITLVVGEGSTTNITVKTPLVTKTNKIPHFFEINGNRISYLDDDKVGAEIEKLIGNLPACNPPNYSEDLDISSSQDYVNRMGDYRACVRNRGLRLTNFQVQTEFYNVKMVNPATFSMVYEPIPSKKGENKDELSLEKSSFNTNLAKLNPQKDYLAFIVRPDSFATFHFAREQAWKKGFQTGWEPHQKELPIVFGSGGKEVGVQ
jgi:hypothetical protein